MTSLGFLDALGIERADYLGQSMGGRTGTMLAIQHPERLNRLMLSASSCGPPSGAYRQMFDEHLQAVAQSEGMEALLEFKVRRDELPESLREGPLAERVQGEVLEEYARDVRRYRERAVHDARFDETSCTESPSPPGCATERTMQVL